jgi:hypothetical protein
MHTEQSNVLFKVLDHLWSFATTMRPFSTTTLLLAIALLATAGLAQAGRGRGGTKPQPVVQRHHHACLPLISMQATPLWAGGAACMARATSATCRCARAAASATTTATASPPQTRVSSSTRERDSACVFLTLLLKAHTCTLSRLRRLPIL